MNDMADGARNSEGQARGSSPILVLVRRASAWADGHEIPVYSHVRGLWLLARALSVQADDRLPVGRRDRVVRPASPLAGFIGDATRKCAVMRAPATDPGLTPDLEHLCAAEPLQLSRAPA